jgi:hypothetical protein
LEEEIHSSLGKSEVYMPLRTLIKVIMRSLAVGHSELVGRNIWADKHRKMPVSGLAQEKIYFQLSTREE